MENLNCSKNILEYLKNYQELQVFFLDPLVAFLKAVQAKCSKYDDNQLMLAVKENLLHLLILGKINVTNGKYMLARNSKRFPQGRRNNPAAPRFQVPSSAIQHQTFSPPQQCGRLTSAEPSPAAAHDVLFYHEGQLPNSSASDILLQRSKNLSASQPREVLNVSPDQVATSAKNLSSFKQLRLVPKEGMTEIPPACMEFLNCGNVPEHAHEVKDEHHDETKTANQTAKALEPVKGNAHGAFLLQHRVKQCRNKVGNLYKIGEKDLMANAKDMPWFFVPELEGIQSLEGNTKQDFSRRNAICISRKEALENFQKIVTAETAHETFNHPQSRDSSPNKRMKYEETGKIKGHVHPEFARKKIVNKNVILQQNHLKKQADEGDMFFVPELEGILSLEGNTKMKDEETGKIKGHVHPEFARKKIVNKNVILQQNHLKKQADEGDMFFVPELEGILSLEGNTKMKDEETGKIKGHVHPEFARKKIVNKNVILQQNHLKKQADEGDMFFVPELEGILSLEGNTKMKDEETGKIKGHVHPEFARKKIVNKNVILQQNHLKKQADEAGKQLATIRPVKVNNEDNSAICSISEYKLKNHPGECLENQHKYGEVSDSMKETTYKMHIPFQNGQLQEHHKIDPPDFQVCLSSTDESGFQFPPSSNNLSIITEARHDDYLKGLEMQRDRSLKQKSQIDDAMSGTFFPSATEFQLISRHIFSMSNRVSTSPDGFDAALFILTPLQFFVVNNFDHKLRH